MGSTMITYNIEKDSPGTMWRVSLGRGTWEDPGAMKQEVAVTWEMGIKYELRMVSEGRMRRTWRVDGSIRV